MSIAQVPRLVAAGRLRADVSLIQTSRPDAEGRLRFGVGVDIAAALVAKARLVATEANARMPLSDSESLALSDVDFAVETDHPLPEYSIRRPTRSRVRWPATSSA
jgi:acyl-CoA hydrolase